MKRSTRLLLISVPALLALVLLSVLGAAYVYVQGLGPLRQGTLALQHLQATVTVTYDERGVPHLQAQSETDLYRALGYVHAQDRLFQMEMMRRLARGELASVLGPKLLDTDRLFRTLGLRAHAEQVVARADMKHPAWQALLAYLDGINQFQATRPLPLEYKLLGLKPSPFTPMDSVAVSGYLAYTFAAAFRTEPVLTFIRDRLGPDYLKSFDLEWHPLGVVSPLAQTALYAGAPPRLQDADWVGLAQLAHLSQNALHLAGLPQLEGSNAWVLSGRRTASGKPLLAGDPHIGFAVPSVWYEAHLQAPGFELYGHHQALNPMALLGHNQQFGWSLTMFQNDDMDLVAEKPNPANPQQVWHQGGWVPLQSREETILVKGQAPVTHTVRHSPNGPLINDVFADTLGSTPIALWWTWAVTDNPLLQAFYELNRASTADKAAHAASQIHAPGLNIVWANTQGDIGWWAAARLPQRPEGVNPAFILDASRGEAVKPGFYRFQDNPQEINPARGYILSANHQPQATSGLPVPGYYNLPARAQRLDELLRDAQVRWDLSNSQALQLDHRTAHGPRVLRPVLAELRTVVIDPAERALLEQLAEWDGSHPASSIAPTVFHQFSYELVRAAMLDELGASLFSALLRTRALDHALPRLTADPNAPWWDRRDTPQTEKRRDILALAWRSSIEHLEKTLGKTPASWVWGKAHTLTHKHPLGQSFPLDWLLNVGPFEVAGGREVLNNLSQPLGPAPWSVSYGPSTRRVIDFADASHAQGINPVGQSGALFDPHQRDQAQDFSAGRYRPMHLLPTEVAAHARGTLTLQPQR